MEKYQEITDFKKIHIVMQSGHPMFCSFNAYVRYLAKLSIFQFMLGIVKYMESPPRNLIEQLICKFLYCTIYI